jgi:hypothetical protein
VVKFEIRLDQGGQAEEVTKHAIDLITARSKMCGADLWIDGESMAWDEDVKENSLVLVKDTEKSIKKDMRELADHKRKQADMFGDSGSDDEGTFEPPPPKLQKVDKSLEVQKAEHEENMQKARALFFFNLRAIQKIEHLQNKQSKTDQKSLVPNAQMFMSSVFQVKVRKQGDVFIVNTTVTDKIRDIKAFLQIETQIPIRNQNLVMSSKPYLDLEDTLSVGHYGINDKTELILEHIKQKVASSSSSPSGAGK